VRRPPGKPYVYGLVDPRTGAVFYVGKGTGTRWMQHEPGAKRGNPGPKNDRIREILDEGLRVECSVLGEFNTEEEAYSAEKEEIAKRTGTLTNQNRGGAGLFCGDAYSFMRARAIRTWRAFPDFDQWSASLGKDYADFAVKRDGSLLSFYRRLRASILSEALSPSPNVARFTPGEGVVFAWEYQSCEVKK